MKQLFISGLILFCLATGSSNAQVPDEASATGDTIAHAAQAAGVAGGPETGRSILQPSPDVPYFTAYVNEDDRAIRRVTLRWQLASEFNTDRFVVERANDLNPTHFDPLHELVAGGDSASGKEYDDRDNPPAGAISFYRLKIVLKNGDAFYSPVVPVDLTGKRALTLQPSVLTTGGTLHLNTNTDYHQPMTINFFDVSGRMTATYLVNSSYFDINTSGWTKGIYIYRIADGHHPLIDAGKIMIM